MNSATELHTPSTTFHYLPLAPPYQPAALGGTRCLTPQQGRALETLAHAIEYLQDELALDCALRGAQHGHVTRRNNALEAIDTLKALSRGLWFSLPLRAPFWRRMLQRHPVAPVIRLPLS
jgi:hypothetical protein